MTEGWGRHGVSAHIQSCLLAILWRFSVAQPSAFWHLTWNKRFSILLWESWGRESLPHSTLALPPSLSGGLGVTATQGNMVRVQS